MSDPLIGKRLSNFIIEKPLGQGGMAQVYHGQDIKLRRPVAIKVIDTRLRGDPAYAKRFIREASAIARWRHENIIQVYYADDQDGLYYYVMEYIDGVDLADLLSNYATQQKMLPTDEVIRIGATIASALDYAHAHGVIHRDIKPANIFMSKDDRIVLGDFGLALDMQQGSSGEVFGTPHYISPEQVRRSSDATAKSDLYSLGIVLYEMLTGVVPFDDISPTSVALQHITQKPPKPRSINPQLSIETENVLLKALSKDPKDRYSSGKALIAALGKALLSTKPSQDKVLPLPPMPASVVSGKARPTTHHLQPEASKKPRKKRRFGLFLSLLLLLAGAYFYADVFLPKGFLSQALSQFESISLPSIVTALPSDLNPIVENSPSPTATATVLPSETPQPTASPTLTQTPSPTFTETATLTATLAASQTPTQTFTPAGTATTVPPTSTPTLIPGEVTATTTPQYINYKRMWLYYDDYAFYIYNAADTPRSISQFTFERLDTNGSPTNTFLGWYWQEFYSILNKGRCMRLEIKGNPNAYLDPPACKNIYLSTLSYAANDDEYIFWTPTEGSSQFRVLWLDEEMGICDIDAGFCEVFVP
ncbi:MAG: serine/threonine protein kinase [Chloroflexi bacterium]|nr:serine/threonine protein kinase [Chloroflexota bacterium]